MSKINSDESTISSLTDILTTYTVIAEEYDRFNGKFSLECITAIGALITASLAVFGVFWKGDADNNYAYLIVSFLACFVPVIVNVYLFITSFHNRRTEVIRCYLIHIEEELEKLTESQHIYNYHRDAIYRGLSTKYFLTNRICRVFIIFMILLCYIGSISVFGICIDNYSERLRIVVIVVAAVSFILNFILTICFMLSNMQPHEKILQACREGIKEPNELVDYRRWIMGKDLEGHNKA